MHLVTGLYRSCAAGGTLDIQGLSIIYLHATQSHSIRKIAHIPILSLG